MADNISVFPCSTIKSPYPKSHWSRFPYEWTFYHPCDQNFGDRAAAFKTQAYNSGFQEHCTKKWPYPYSTMAPKKGIAMPFPVSRQKFVIQFWIPKGEPLFEYAVSCTMVSLQEFLWIVYS